MGTFGAQVLSIYAYLSIVSAALTLGFVAFLILDLIILVIITSLPIYAASVTLVSKRKATFGRAVIATIAAIIAFLLLSGIFGLLFPLLGIIIGFIGILAVLRVIYDFGWLSAFVMAVIAFIFMIIILIILSLVGLAISFATFSYSGGFRA